MSTPTTQNSKATRSSLACLPCRSRHQKCDGAKPSCTRCVQGGGQCNYARSRRGGLDRAALAERRKRLTVPDTCSGGQNEYCVSQDDRLFNRGVPSQHITAEPDFESYGETSVGEESRSGMESSGTGSSVLHSPAAAQPHIDNIDSDVLIDSYYTSFHKFHPFILPRKHLTKLHCDPNNQTIFKPLIAIMRLVGNCYRSRELSIPLKDYAEACLAEGSPTDPIMVQARLLYSMILFWYGREPDSKREMDSAIRLGLDFGMFRQAFAEKQGGEDLVVRESWRRTWWMLYIIDTYYAGTLGSTDCTLWDIETDVDLPCEESEYESREIPEPRSLEEFDSREFATDNTNFSSFAYLIGAVRSASLAVFTGLKRFQANKEPSTVVIQRVDSILDGWLRLLPSDKKVMNKAGEIDELLFQAHLLIHVSTVSLHRPFSDLKFNPVEAVSSCAREPPPDTPTPDLVNVHTVRVLRAAEAQIGLLTLPTRQFHHTPFTTCMVSEGALALLSACKFLLKGSELAIARDQIRVTIGCLKALAEYWPRTARNVREMQTIAQHVLGLGVVLGKEQRQGQTGNAVAPESYTPSSSEVPGLSSGSGASDGQGSADAGGFDTEASISDSDILGSLGLFGGGCGWSNYNLGDDFNLQASWEGTGMDF
ncbi:hypothetical protein BJX99DRAFT_253279 [Aspergillus californicus]